MIIGIHSRNNDLVVILLKVNNLQMSSVWNRWSCYTNYSNQCNFRVCLRIYK